MCRLLNQRLDVNSSSNYEDVVTKHTDIELGIDFERTLLVGSTTISFEAQTSHGLKDLVLDTRSLKIHGVYVRDKPVQWELKPWTDPNGRPLHIRLGRVYTMGETFDIKVDFETEKDSAGLQWFSPSQSDDKTYPFMFSQCEPVHARSIFPCQDTPSIKTTFTIRVRSVLPVVASGVPEHDLIFAPVVSIAADKLYTFNQTIPISNYLFSIASGNLAGEQIGPRSYLYCAPGDLQACKSELKPDLEAIIASAEASYRLPPTIKIMAALGFQLTPFKKLIYAYPWPLYNLVILPKSFHLGGMENPVFNFYSATVISGDRENISVLAHEFAHSYSGNLVTNASWEHFWLNEGWTVYIERHILSELRGDDERKLHSMIGWQELLYGIKSYGGNESPSTRLVLDFQNQRPDDVMSKISYEKGYVFLCYLEGLVGNEKWLSFIPHYFRTFFCKSVTSEQFKTCLLDFFASDGTATELLRAVDWETWYHKPGAPLKPDFQCKRYDDCITLANNWDSLSDISEYQPSPGDVDGWTVSQLLAFLDALMEKARPLPATYVSQLGSTYKINESTNLEVVCRYLRVALQAGSRDVIKQTREVLGKTGRMKFVRPLFECLIAVDQTVALQTFNELRDFYHPTCVRLVENVLRTEGLL